jgi:hypothetical protein
MASLTAGARSGCWSKSSASEMPGPKLVKRLKPAERLLLDGKFGNMDVYHSPSSVRST